MAKKQKRRKNSTNFIEALQFVKESRNYLYIILVLFILFILIGYFFPIFFVDVIENFIKGLADKTAGYGFFKLLFYILQNNISASFSGMIFGVIFGIFPLLAIIFNGYVLGFVMNRAAGIAGGFVLLKLIPHGIFEVPALIISLGLGLRLGFSIFSKKYNLSYCLRNSLKVFLFIVLPLLLIAGLIETALIIIFG